MQHRLCLKFSRGQIRATIQFFWKKTKMTRIFLGTRMCPEFLFKLLSVLNPPSQRRKSWENRSRI